MIPAICGSISFLMLYILVLSIFDTVQHPLYSVLSTTLMFVSALIIFKLSFRRSITVQFACLMWTMYFTHRFAITYFLPESLDYHAYLNFSIERIEGMMFYYLMCVLGFYCGVLLAKLRLTSKQSGVVYVDVRKGRAQTHNSISVFGVDVAFEALLKPLFYVVCAFVIFKIFGILVLNEGITGALYTADSAVLMRFLALGDTLSVPVAFAMVYLPRTSPILRLAKITFFFMVISTLFTTSRALILWIVLNLYVSARILNVRINKKYYVWGFVAIILSVFIYYPLITSFRNVLLSGDINHLSLKANYTDLVLEVSGRLGNAYESFLLWFSEAEKINLDQFSLITDAFQLINSLVPGEIIPVPELVNTAKLQVVVGRGASVNTLTELGGHGENVGQWGTVFLYFEYFGFFYWAFLFYILIKLENSDIHPFWKYFFVTIYASGPRGFILMSATNFTFLVMFFLLAVAIVFRDVFMRSLHISLPPLK